MSYPSAPPPGPPQSIGLSVASMVLGIISLVIFCFWYISIPLAIIAIVLGVIGMKSGGKGMAIAGLVCGIVTIALVVLLLIGGLAFISFLNKEAAVAKDALKDAFKDFNKLKQ